MNPLDSYIEEGILRRQTTVKQAGNEALLDELKKYSYDNIKVGLSNWFKKNSVWEKGEVIATDKGLELYCNETAKALDLRDLPASHPDFKICKFDSGSFGEFHIDNCDITSLEGIFTPDCEFRGHLYIYDNERLSSLKGLPRIIHEGNDSWKDTIVLDDTCPALHISKPDDVYKVLDDLPEKIYGSITIRFKYGVDKQGNSIKPDKKYNDKWSTKDDIDEILRKKHGTTRKNTVEIHYLWKH